MMRLALAVAMMLCGIAAGQTASSGVERFALRDDGLTIRRHVEAGTPFTVAGMHSVIVGRQEGVFEAWVLPVKLLSNLRIGAEVEGYAVPIDVNAHAAEIEVSPDRTVISYSHIAFTVRQIMFAPNGTEDGTGAVVLFQVDAVRPMDLTFRFTPEMRPMWPQPGSGAPSAEWVARGSGGFYVLHTDFPNFAGAVAMPGAKPGIMAPYQERPQFHPLELKLHYDPRRDGNRYFPLLMAVGRDAETASNAALSEKIDRLGIALGRIYEAHADMFARMERELTTIHTPDAGFNDAFSWGAISIEQLRAKAVPSGEVGLVAGYYASGDSARPGFGWFFGRDALYTLYAVNGFGDFALSRQELEFLIARQRDDGKIMHEYSLTAAFLDWKSLPYMYAAADATPLFLTAMLDYVRASGDVEFLRKHRDAVEKAWRFETAHDADGDGIYDNSQGTGWVESWPPGMPKQEIYLALLDQQASQAMSKLAEMLGDGASADAAAKRALAVGKTIEAEYFDSSRNGYAFSKNAGATDWTATIYPAIAWWNGGEGRLAHAGASFSRWASHDFSTDWGLRDVAASDPLYDPISYHQGSVWPLFTGWTAVAEYREGRALSGYAHLMQNADQTTSQDLGAVTELLSGDLFAPFGRSTSHQLWSSAMVVTPALRGMFGIEVDALTHTVRLDPHLPATWDQTTVESLHVGDSTCSLIYERKGRELVVRAKTVKGEAVHLKGAKDEALVAKDGSSISFPLPPVEVEAPHGLPLRGARTTQMKILSETQSAGSLHLELEAAGGAEVELRVRRNGAKLTVRAEGGTMIADDRVRVRFPDGEGYRRQALILSW
jgi:glycogen debranching enzyme